MRASTSSVGRRLSCGWVAHPSSRRPSKTACWIRKAIRFSILAAVALLTATVSQAATLPFQYVRVSGLSTNDELVLNQWTGTGSNFNTRKILFRDLNASIYPLNFAETITTNGIVPMPICWLDAGNSGGTFGSALSTWFDRMGNYNATSLTASIRPTLNASRINGRPAVTFDGTSDFMTIQSLNAITIATNVTIYIVFKPGTGGSCANAFNTAGTWGSGAGLYYQLNSTLHGWNSGPGGPVNPQFAPRDTNDVYVAALTYDGTKVISRINGVAGQQTDLSTGLGISGAIQLGQLLALGNYFKGDMAEVILWNRALTAEQCVAVEDTLLPKYGKGGRKIVFVGDSLTYGQGALGGSNFPAVVSQMLGEQNTVNIGVPGLTAATIAAYAYTNIATGLHPGDIAVLRAGCNDLNASAATGLVFSNIAATANLFRKAGARTFVTTITARTSANGSYAADAATVNAALRARSWEFSDGIIDLAHGPALTTFDGVHETNASQVLVARQVSELLAGWTGSLGCSNYVNYSTYFDGTLELTDSTRSNFNAIIMGRPDDAVNSTRLARQTGGGLNITKGDNSGLGPLRASTVTADTFVGIAGGGGISATAPTVVTIKNSDNTALGTLVASNAQLSNLSGSGSFVAIDGSGNLSKGTLSASATSTNVFGGIYTTVFGTSAADGATNIGDGVFVGHEAGQTSTNAPNSVLIGYGAGKKLSSTTANGSQAVTGIGWLAFQNAQEMSSAVGIGYQVGDGSSYGGSSVVVGTHNFQAASDYGNTVALGYYIGASSSGWRNSVLLGTKADGTGGYKLWIDGYRGANLEPSVPLISGDFLARYYLLRGSFGIDNTLESSNSTALFIKSSTTADNITVTNNGTRVFAVTSGGNVTAAGSVTASAVGTNIFGGTSFTNGINSTLSNSVPAVVATVSGSPYHFTNSTGHILFANLSGGAVQGVALNGAFWCAAFTNSAAFVPLKAGEYLSITNTTVPKLAWLAL